MRQHHKKSVYGIVNIGSVLKNDGKIGIVTMIDNVRYEFTSLFVDYRLKELTEWSDYDIKEAVKNYRLSKFKIVK